MFIGKVKVDVLREVIGVLRGGGRVEEATFNFNAEGLNVRVLDPSHVAMVDLDLGKEAFEELGESDVKLGVELSKFKDLMKLAKAGSLVQVDYLEQEKLLQFKLDRVTMRVALVDTGMMQEVRIPQIQFPALISIARNELERGVRAAEMVGDLITLTSSPDFFKLEARTEKDSVELEIPAEELVKVECDDVHKSQFDLDFFLGILKTVSSAENITLHLGSDIPVKMEFDLAENQGHVIYFLAPRVEGD